MIVVMIMVPMVMSADEEESESTDHVDDVSFSSDDNCVLICSQTHC
jgi:hypothetical protein